MTDTDNPRALAYCLTEDELVFGDIAMDEAPDLLWAELMSEILDPPYTRHDPTSQDRTVDMALALFAKAIQRNEFDGLSRLDIFGACLYQAEIWERG